MIRYWCFLCAFCCFTTMLLGQNGVTVLDKLQAGETLEIDWVQQQYLPDSGSVVGEYPLFPDQLKEGEGEMHTRLSLQLTAEQQLTIKVISVFCLKSGFTYPSNLNGIEEELAINKAAFLPTIEDTRYYFNANRPMPKIYKELSKIPILYNFDNGVVNKNWFKAIAEATKVMPSYLNAIQLEHFLSKVLSAQWVSKEYYQLVTTKDLADKLSVHFFCPKFPPQKTIIQGVIHNFHEPKVSLSNHREGSLIKFFDRQEDFALDSLGQFKIELTHDRPLLFQLHHVFYQFQVYVEPGDSLNISINANAFFRDVKFSGDNAISNEVFLEVYHGLDSRLTEVGYVEITQLTQVEYIIEFHKRQAYALRFIEEKKKIISTEFYQFINRHILIRNAISALAQTGSFYYDDGYLTPEFQDYCQKLNRIFFRLPTGSPNYFWALENYTGIYYHYVLSGKYQNLEINTPLDFRFTLGNLFLVAPENIFKLSEISLFSSANIYFDKATLKLYQDLEAGCTLKESKEILADYRDSTNSFPDFKFFRYLMKGQNAPNWRFRADSENDISLSDFKGEFLLLHIGLEKNLAAAKSDIVSIKQKTKSDFRALSIISKDSIDNDNYKDEVLYIKPSEMQMLRDSYLINTNANMFFIIDPDSKIKNNLYDTNSHKDLTQMVGKFTKPKESWQPSPLFWRNLGIHPKKKNPSQKRTTKTPISRTRIKRHPCPNESPFLIQCPKFYSEPNSEKRGRSCRPLFNPICGFSP